MMNLSKENLLRSAQRALLFGVTKSLRYLSLEVRDDLLCVLVHLDSEPSIEEQDVFFSSAGEIQSDFPTLKGNQVSFFVSSNPFDELEHLQLLVFARAD
jgi:hypothetical protein